MRPHWVLGGAVAAAGIGIALRTEHGRRRNAWTPPRGTFVDGPLHARVLGHTGQPVILLHGLLGSGAFWGGAYDRLADHGVLVVPDLLGFGRSPKPPSGYSLMDHVAAVEALLDRIGVTEPAVIGAHSLGGLIAVGLAARSPARVSAIVAFGPPLYASHADARRAIAGLGALARLTAIDSPLGRAACAWMCNHRAAAARLSQFTHPSLPAVVAQDAVQHTWASYSNTMQNVILAANIAGSLQDLDVPIHFIAGDSDRVVDLDLLRCIADRRNNMTLDIWPGRHDLPITQPERCCAAIAASLPSVTSDRSA